MNVDYAMMTDLYQMTMAQGYWEHGMGDTEACFHMYFRNYPFKGGYAIACGMDQLAELVDTYTFDDAAVDFLAALPARQCREVRRQHERYSRPASLCRTARAKQLMSANKTQGYPKKHRIFYWTYLSMEL